MRPEATALRWGPLLLCSWPGLPGLWIRGKFSSLILALAFSVLLNLTLISSFLWPWSLGETFLAIAWPTLAAVWLGSAWVAYHKMPDWMAVPVSEKVADERPPDTLFIQAQSEYLKGHWEEAETCLQRQLEKAPRDVEARLLLATLLRHTRQFEEARTQLRELNKYDEAIEWGFELDREWALLDLIEQHEQSAESVKLEQSGTAPGTMADERIEAIPETETQAD